MPSHTKAEKDKKKKEKELLRERLIKFAKGLKSRKKFKVPKK